MRRAEIAQRKPGYSRSSPSWAPPQRPPKRMKMTKQFSQSRFCPRRGHLQQPRVVRQLLGGLPWVTNPPTGSTLKGLPKMFFLFSRRSLMVAAATTQGHETDEAMRPVQSPGESAAADAGPTKNIIATFMVESRRILVAWGSANEKTSAPAKPGFDFLQKSLLS